MRSLIARIEEHVAALLLAAVTLLIVAQLVLTRAAPRLSSPLTTVVLALFVWATLLGVPAATRRGAHLSLGLLRVWLPTRWRPALNLLLLLAALAFFVTLAVTGLRICYAQATVQHNRFEGASWPAWAVSASIPLAAALSCVRAVQAWRNAGKESEESSRQEAVSSKQ